MICFANEFPMKFLKIPGPSFLFSFTASSTNILHFLFIYCYSGIYLLCKVRYPIFIKFNGEQNAFLWHLLANFLNVLGMWPYILHASALRLYLATP